MDITLRIIVVATYIIILNKLNINVIPRYCDRKISMYSIGTLQSLYDESINVFIIETSDNDLKEFLRGSYKLKTFIFASHNILKIPQKVLSTIMHI